MKKFLAVILAALFVFSMAACSNKPADNGADKAETKTPELSDGKEETEANTELAVAKEDMKVGFIFIGDDNEGYTYAHKQGALEMAKELGLSDSQVIFKELIPENEKCYEAAVDLAEQGCQIIFANSFSHENFMMQAAAEFPDVQFCHATGYQAATSGLANMHNYFTSVYESRYVSGVVAGLKLKQLIDEGTLTADKAKLGYVGAKPYAEVKSGFTAFFLGVQSIVPEATMEVKYTGSWADQAAEKEVAEALIADGCVLISQHADTTGAPTACEAAKTYSVGYNVSMIDVAPNYALTSASINWGPYYTYAVKSVMEGKEIAVDWCQGYADGADKITELNKNAIAPGTEEKVAEVEAAIKDGSLKVFDTSKWTVNGETITSTKDIEGYFGNEYILKDGDVSYFAESTLASAPSFAFVVDGITELVD